MYKLHYIGWCVPTERQHYITIVKEKAALKGRGRRRKGRKEKKSKKERPRRLISREESQWLHFHLAPQTLVKPVAQLVYLVIWTRKNFLVGGTERERAEHPLAPLRNYILDSAKTAPEYKTPNFKSELGVKYTYIISALVVEREKADINFLVY